VRAQLTIYSKRRKTPSDVNVFQRQDNKAQAGKTHPSSIHYWHKVCVCILCARRRRACVTSAGISRKQPLLTNTHIKRTAWRSAQTHARSKEATNKIKSLDAHLSFKFTFALRVRSDEERKRITSASVCTHLR
jgi:hypothetical protein